MRKILEITFASIVVLGCLAFVAVQNFNPNNKMVNWINGSKAIFYDADSLMIDGQTIADSTGFVIDTLANDVYIGEDESYIKFTNDDGQTIRGVNQDEVLYQLYNVQRRGVLALQDPSGDSYFNTNLSAGLDRQSFIGTNLFVRGDLLVDSNITVPNFISENATDNTLVPKSYVDAISPTMQAIIDNSSDFTTASNLNWGFNILNLDAAQRVSIDGEFKVDARETIFGDIDLRADGYRLYSSNGAELYYDDDEAPFDGLQYIGSWYVNSTDWSNGSLLPKVYIDQLLAAKLNITDTATMLSTYVRGTGKVKQVLDFPSTGASLSSEITVAVPGATDGDLVVLGIPKSATLLNSCYTAYVINPDEVSVKFNNYKDAAQDPAAGNFSIKIIK